MLSDETETGNLNLFEGDILLKEGEKPYGYRKRRETVMEVSVQNTEQHIWPNATVYYEFEQTLGESFTCACVCVPNIFLCVTYRRT